MIPASRAFCRACAFSALVCLAAATPAQEPSPVRHHAQLPGAELLILRHQYLERGRHEDFYQTSREAVWPLYEKIGARVVGQWQVLLPEDGARELDEGYRLARYRSFEHWLATRLPATLAGNGDDAEASRDAITQRNRWRTGSKGAIFLTGEMAAGGPYHFPPMDESYRPVPPGEPSPENLVHPIRSERAKTPDRELVTLRRFRIVKGSFAELDRLTRETIWPFQEKMGARAVGLWRVVYPTAEDFASDPRVPPPADLEAESPDHDEAYMMVRYAGREHWEATRRDVMHRLGGDGEDHRAALAAEQRRDELVLESEVLFLRGHFYSSPPIYLPSLDERWELDETTPQRER